MHFNEIRKNIKVIFLDIDGVLNSLAYDRGRKENDGNIDETRLPLIKQIVDETQAKIVLSSSWRTHWNKDFHCATPLARIWLLCLPGINGDF